MGVARLLRVGSPYNGEELFDLDFEQSADVLYLAHIDHPPTKLLRYAHDSWEFKTIAWGPTLAPPTGLNVTATVANTDAANGGDAYFPLTDYYAVTAVNDESGQESRISNVDSATNDLGLKRNQNLLSWTASAGANRYRAYKRHENGSFGYIGTTTDLNFLDDNITPDPTDGPPEGQNYFAVAGDYPSTVTFHDQRSVWGKTRNRPNVVWASRSGDFENLDISRPLKDSDSYAVGIVAAKVNAVNQLVSAEGLYALASSNIFELAAGDEALSPKQPHAKRIIGRGSSRLNPIVVDNTIFYRPVSGSAMRAMNYSFELDGVKSDDMTIFSPHFFERMKIVDWAYQEEPHSCIWAVRSDGKLLCFTWEQEQQVWGWTLCETDGRVMSVCSIMENGEDRLYLVVERTIAGDSKTYVERMASALWDTVDSGLWLDCARSYDFGGTPQQVIQGLFHLEFRDVIAVVDGVIENHTVSGGEITLSKPATRVSVGLPYDAEIETLPLVLPAGGTNTAKRQQPAQVVLRLRNSRGVLVGPQSNRLQEIKERILDGGYGPPPLLDGLYEAGMANVTENKTVAFVKGTPGLPMTVTAVYLDPFLTEG